MATPQELLVEAQSAYHDLQIGKAVSVARDSNGEEVRYTQASRPDLANYIAALQSQIGNTAGSTSTILGPMRLQF